MTGLADLLRAVASLLWPILTFIALLMFRKQIQTILGRLKRGKVLGQEIELEESLQELNESADAAASETPSLPQIPPPAQLTANADQSASALPERILDEAARSPRVGLILLASELEKNLRQLLASMGLLDSARATSLPQSIRTLEGRGALPKHLAGSVQSFWKLRSQLVHGHDASRDDIIRAIDSGLTILRTIQAIPHEINVVYHPGVDVFSDAEGSKRRPGVKAVVLETTSPGGAEKSLRVYPTTRTHFEKGRRVAWEWNRELKYDESWYRHPDTGEVTYGWTGSLEFVGRNIDDL